MENKEHKGIIGSIANWFNNLSIRGLLRAVFISFIIIIVLLSVSYLPGIMSKISSSLSAAIYSVFIPAENATVTVDNKIIDSGENFTVTFKKGDITTEGLFTISYACDPNLSLLSVESAGLKNINCDTPYYLLENSTSITIKAITKDNIIRLALDASFENTTTQKTEKVGVARVIIKNSSVGIVSDVSTSSNSTPTKPVINNTPAYIPTVNYYAKPDLAVRILQVGLLNSATNLITTRNQFTYQDMVGIKFEVRNDGDTITGPWYFTASLPSISTPSYNSGVQISLRPGESIVFTLGFSNLSNLYQSLITINADPNNAIAESNEYNNIITQTITNTSYNNNYYNNNNNNTYNNGYYDSYGNFIYYNNNNYNNGCYINGVYTYNCYNNSWNYNYSNLYVSCYANPSYVDTGDRVRWYVNVSGGDGDYTYDWTGSNSLNSSAENPSKTYSTSGTKRATVTVTDGNDYEATADCSVYVN